MTGVISVPLSKLVASTVARDDDVALVDEKRRREYDALDGHRDFADLGVGMGTLVASVARRGRTTAISMAAYLNRSSVRT